MDEMLSAAVPRKLRVRTSIMFGTVRMPLRMLLVVLATGMLAVLALLAGLPLIYAGTSFVFSNAVFALTVEARWGTRWVNRSTWSVLRIWWRQLRRPPYLRLQPVPLVVELTVPMRVVRPIRWTLEQDGRQESMR
jgi:hypothetical protein